MLPNYTRELLVNLICRSLVLSLTLGLIFSEMAI